MFRIINEVKNEKNIKKNLFKMGGTFFSINFKNKIKINNLHMSRIFNGVDNFNDASKPKIEILKEVIISQLMNEKFPICAQSHVFTGRNISPENMFSGVITRSDVAVKNYNHFVKNEDGRLKGASLYSGIALGFCGYNLVENEETYVYKINYPMIFIYGPDVFSKEKSDSNVVFEEYEVASCVGFPGCDIKSAEVYQWNKNNLKVINEIVNCDYKRRDFAIQATTTFREEHDSVNDVYCKNKKISKKYTGINIDLAELLEQFTQSLNMENHQKLETTTLILDALPADMSLQDQKNLISLIFELKNEILDESEHGSNKKNGFF